MHVVARNFGHEFGYVVGAIQESPLRERSALSKIIGYIKMNVSKEIHKQFGDAVVWQRGFHDHIIRNHEDYEKNRQIHLRKPDQMAIRLLLRIG